MAKERLTKERKEMIRQAFERQFQEDPNLDAVYSRYNLYDGDWLDVKVKDIWASEFPEIYEGLNVFVEEVSAFSRALTQG